MRKDIRGAAKGAGFIQDEEKAQGKSYWCLQLPNGKNSTLHLQALQLAQQPGEDECMQMEGKETRNLYTVKRPPMELKKQNNKVEKMNQKNLKGKWHTYAELSEAKRHTAEPAQMSLNNGKIQHLSKSKTESNPEDKRIKENQLILWQIRVALNLEIPAVQLDDGPIFYMAQDLGYWLICVTLTAESVTRASAVDKRAKQKTYVPVLNSTGFKRDVDFITTLYQEAKQPQFPQLLLIRLVLQTLHQLRCPSLDTLQHLNVSLVVRGPKLNTVFEVQPHQCRVQGHDHFPTPAGHTIPDTSQDAIGLLGHLGTPLAHIQAVVNQHPQVLSRWAAFQPLFPKPAVLHGVVVTHVQDLTLGLVEPHTVGPLIQLIYLSFPNLIILYKSSNLNLAEDRGLCDRRAPFVVLMKIHLNLPKGSYELFKSKIRHLAEAATTIQRGALGPCVLWIRQIGRKQSRDGARQQQAGRSGMRVRKEDRVGAENTFLTSRDRCRESCLLESERASGLGRRRPCRAVGHLGRNGDRLLILAASGGREARRKLSCHKAHLHRQPQHRSECSVESQAQLFSENASERGLRSARWGQEQGWGHKDPVSAATSTKGRGDPGTAAQGCLAYRSLSASQRARLVGWELLSPESQILWKFDFYKTLALLTQAQCSKNPVTRTWVGETTIQPRSTTLVPLLGRALRRDQLCKIALIKGSTLLIADCPFPPSPAGPGYPPAELQGYPPAELQGYPPAELRRQHPLLHQAGQAPRLQIKIHLRD
ncbi:hypothetical protein QYF61_000746, partial [Mycteria americana]